MRFLGNITAKSDNKGRLFLPAAFRKVLHANGVETLVLRKDLFEDCLVLYPESVWNERIDALKERLNKFNRTHMQILRQYVADTEEITLDSNGRLLLSKHLIEQAGIGTEVHFIGMDDAIEIWASEKLEHPFMEAEDFQNALEDLMK